VALCLGPVQGMLGKERRMRRARALFLSGTVVVLVVVLAGQAFAVSNTGTQNGNQITVTATNPSGPTIQVYRP